MSVKLITEAFGDERLSSTQTLIMVALADNANDEGVCYPHLETIIAKTKLKRTAVVSNLKKLSEMGILLKSYRARKKGGRSSNIYLLYPDENFAKLDDVFRGFFDENGGEKVEPKFTKRHQVGKSQSSLNGTETGSQSSLNGTQPTVYREPSLKNEPSLILSDVSQIAHRLLEKIHTLNPKYDPPNIKSWEGDIEKMIRIDGHAAHEIIQAIEWIYGGSKAGSFWIPNVMSGAKLRKHFDRMWMQAAQEQGVKREFDQGMRLIEEVRDAS